MLNGFTAINHYSTYNFSGTNVREISQRTLPSLNGSAISVVLADERDLVHTAVEFMMDPPVYP